MTESRMNGKRTDGNAAPLCPVCGRPASPEHRPFCSSRCRAIDLGRWLSGDYRIDAGEAEGPVEDETD